MAEYYCPESAKVPHGLGYSLAVAVTNPETSKTESLILKDCGITCNHGLLGEYSNTLFVVITVVGIISVLIMFAAIISHLFKTTKSHSFYPEKAIFYLLICYFFISLVIVISNFYEHQSVCQNSNKDNEIFRIQRHNKVQCTLVHSFLIYFFIASQMWWLVYAVSTYMLSKPNWCAETVSRQYKIFHSFAWIVPCIFTFITLLFEYINADISSGLCFISSQDTKQLYGFFVFPLIFSLLFGEILIIIGLTNFVRTKKILIEGEKNDAENDYGEDGAELFDQVKSMNSYLIRIGVFSLIHFIVSTTLLASVIYESKSISHWHSVWLETHCKTNSDSSCSNLKFALKTEEKTAKEIFIISLIKLGSWHVVGLSGMVWITTKTTKRKWKALIVSPVSYFSSSPVNE
ncbi:MAG: G-protein coupled receptor Fz Smo [Paramarteilia canceri]